MASSANIDLSGHRAAIPPIVGALFADVDDLVVLIGADLRPRWSSRPLTNFFDEGGTIAAGALGGAVHPDDQPHMQQLRGELLATPGKTVECTLRVVTADGAYEPVRVRGTNHFHDPSIDGFIVTVHWPERADDRRRAAPGGRPAKRSGSGRDRETSKLATSTFAPRDLIDDVHRAVDSLSGSRGVEVSTSVDAALPSTVRAARSHLRTILNHLATSAIRTAPVDGESPTQISIDVSLAAEASDQLRFTISTVEAEGIVGDDVRWTATIGDAELMSAAALVDKLGGSIDISSDDRSRTMTFDVPYQPARRLADQLQGDTVIRAASSPPAARREPAIAPRVQTSGCVLVVDDSDVNRLLAVSQLDRLGYPHIEASSGEDALRIMRSSNVALVLMDWHMPGTDGLEATRRWRTIEDGAPPLPIVSMTASAMEGDRERCLAAGASDYLPKPVSISDLASTLERWMPAETPLDVPPESCPTDPIDELVAELGDVSVVQSIVRTYIEAIPTELTDARAAWSNGDRPVVRRCAHTLKSTATMLGYTGFASVCADLEAQAQRDEGDLTSLLERFAEGCHQTAASLQEVAHRLEDRPPT